MSVAVRLFCVLLAFAAPTANAADDVLPARGHGSGAVHVGAFVSRAAYDDDGVAIAEPAVALRTRSLTGALHLGIGDGLGLHASLPLVMAMALHDAGTVVVGGVGDVEVGLALQLWADGPLQLVVRGDVKVPLYASQPAIQGRQPLLQSSTTPGALPAIGDGQVDATLSGVLVAGFPFGGHFQWAQGYRFRTGGVTDGVVGSGRVVVPTLGGWLVPRWDHAFLFSFDPPVDDAGLATEIVGRSLVQTGPGVTIPLSRLSPGLALDVSAALLFRGRNAVGGGRFDVGVIHAF